MDKNTTISERITQVIDYLGVNPNVFAKKLGYGRSQALYDIINSKSKPSFDFFDKFCNSEYSEMINLNWLVTGKGEMENNPTDNYKKQLDTTTELNEPESFLQKRVKALEISIDLMSQEIQRLRNK